MSGEVEKCPILHVRPKFDVFTLNANANLSGGARGLFFGPGLPLLPYFVYARSKVTGKTVYAKACLRLHCLPM